MLHPGRCARLVSAIWHCRLCKHGNPDYSHLLLTHTQHHPFIQRTPAHNWTHTHKHTCMHTHTQTHTQTHRQRHRHRHRHRHKHRHRHRHNSTNTTHTHIQKDF